MLASSDLLDHITDVPWPGCQVDVGPLRITWMSSGIATMILVAILLLVALPWMTRRYMLAAAGGKRTLPGGVLEVVVLFIRDQIAVPSMGAKKAHAFLPFLLTIFVFVLGMNLSGLTPLSAISGWISHKYPIGHTPTSILSVCGALALLALLTIVTSGLWHAAKDSHKPLWIALPLSPILWFLSLSPHVPGMIGKILTVPLAVLELIGVVAKCFALMIRLFANMVAGHILLAVLMMFTVETLVSTVQTAMDPAAANEIHFFYVGPVCIVGSVLVDLMELLVAGLQAYIYTFLTAMFLGLYVAPEH